LIDADHIISVHQSYAITMNCKWWLLQV